jgi:hypothetical protein
MKQIGINSASSKLLVLTWLNHQVDHLLYFGFLIISIHYPFVFDFDFVFVFVDVVVAAAAAVVVVVVAVVVVLVLVLILVVVVVVPKTVDLISRRHMSMTKTDNISIDELIKIGGILQQVRESEQVGIRRIQAKHNGFPKSTH